MINKYGKVFNNHSEVALFLKTNKSDIIQIKKATLKFTDVLGITPTTKVVDKSLVIGNSDVIQRTVVANCYGYMDNHDDVHITGIFTKSIKENQKNILHLHDHIFELSAKVGVFKKIYENLVDWTKLGYNKAGQTMCLLGDSEIRKALNPCIFDQYDNNEINQHSVGMLYVTMYLCINDPLDLEHYDNWNKYFPFVGNGPEAINQGYFWAVTEAKLKEISAVIQGSNDLTPTLAPQDTIQPPISTVSNKIEPSLDTHSPSYNPNLF